MIQVRVPAGQGRLAARQLAHKPDAQVLCTDVPLQVTWRVESGRTQVTHKVLLQQVDPIDVVLELRRIPVLLCAVRECAFVPELAVQRRVLPEHHDG
jgi:hypothetical protein